MANPLDYGLPGQAALDRPFGLPPTQDPTAPAPLQVLEFNLPQPVASGLRSGSIRPGAGVVAAGGNIVPFRATNPSFRPGAAPVVGRDITLDKFTDLLRNIESSGNYQALNRERKGNTASGAYQYTDSTWNNYGGYAKAMQAPREVQDRRFAEDVANRVAKYSGDMFRVIAEHRLPAQANSPELWRQPARVRVQNGYTTVYPMEDYIRKFVRGTPFEKQFDDYLNGQ